MKLHVTFESGDLKVDEVIEGADAEAVVAGMQQRVAKNLRFPLNTLVKGMTPLAFAQEVTRRYNASAHKNAVLPRTCDDFVRNAVEKRYATVLES